MRLSAAQEVVVGVSVLRRLLLTRNDIGEFTNQATRLRIAWEFGLRRCVAADLSNVELTCKMKDV